MLLKNLILILPVIILFSSIILFFGKTIFNAKETCKNLMRINLLKKIRKKLFSHSYYKQLDSDNGMSFYDIMCLLCLKYYQAIVVIISIQ